MLSRNDRRTGGENGVWRTGTEEKVGVGVGGRTKRSTCGQVRTTSRRHETS